MEPINNSKPSNCIFKSDSVRKNSVCANSQCENVKSDSFKNNSSKPIISENVVKTYGCCLNNNFTEYSGSINEKNINLVQADVKTCIMNREYRVQGLIDTKEIDLAYDKYGFAGSYDDTEFDLKIKKGDTLLDRFSGRIQLVGTINGEQVEFDLSSSNIPEDEKTRDILSTGLMLLGKTIKTKDGHFDGIKNAKWYKKEIEEMIIMNAMFQQTMV